MEGPRLTRASHMLPPLSRRQFMNRMAALGIAGTSVGALAACAEDDEPTDPDVAPPTPTRPLTVAFHEAHLTRYAVLDEINSELAEQFDLDAQQAPVEGFGATFFLAEAANEESTWDVYTSMTPFIEMLQLARAGAIAPWDDYLSADVLDDILPKVRDEGSVDGQLFNFPWVIDIVMGAGNASVLERADLDPDTIPATWDEFVANARQVMDRGAAVFGAAFDASGWRSIAPIAHSISTDIYTEDGLLDFTHDAVVEALEIMRRIFEVTSPASLDPGAEHGGFGGTPDRGVWAAEDAGYYIQFTNAPITLANNWVDPGALRLGNLPSVQGGEGSTVFWTTGISLFTFGENKEAAAEYVDALTTDERMWRAAVGDDEPIGQLPGRTSVWASWEQERPDWLADWALESREALERANAIENHLFSFDQFILGRPHWETFLTGEEADPRRALQAAKDAVLEEVEEAAS